MPTIQPINFAPGVGKRGVDAYSLGRMLVLQGEPFAAQAPSEELQRLGIPTEKSERFIPEAYLLGPHEDRLSLLRGMMDQKGRMGVLPMLDCASELLARQVQELVCSLGGTARVAVREARQYRYFNVTMRLDTCPFMDKAKSVQWKRPLKRGGTIASVEHVGRKQAQCISVSSKRHLYVTDGYLVTHNTVTAFTALSNPDCLPALIVAPTHLVKQWEAQAARFVPGLRVRVLRTGDPTKESPTRVRGREVLFPDILITTYGKVGGWVSALAPFISTLIAEEAHELRGDPAGVRNVAMRALSDSVRYFMQLTATPIYNYGGEVFRVLDILSPGVLGTEEEFAREWCGGASRVEKARLSTQQLQALSNHLRLNGIMLRRTRKDVGRELPRAQTIIQSIPADMAVIEKAETASAELARIILDQQGIKGLAKLQAGQELDMKMRQATGIAKAPAVAEFVRTIIQSRDDGTPEPVVLTGWHREVYSIWAELLAEFKPAFFTGTESPAQKAESVRRFTSGETPLFIMSNRSGAGLDGLQAVCCNVVIGEPDWANGVHVQIGGRLDREGQKQEVTIWFPLADAGTDPIVAEVAGIKADQLTILLDPDAPLVEEVGNGEDRIRRLAEIVLKRRASAPTGPENAEAAA